MDIDSDSICSEDLKRPLPRHIDVDQCGAGDDRAASLNFPENEAEWNMFLNAPNELEGGQDDVAGQCETAVSDEECTGSDVTQIQELEGPMKEKLNQTVVDSQVHSEPGSELKLPLGGRNICRDFWGSQFAGHRSQTFDIGFCRGLGDQVPSA